MTEKAKGTSDITLSVWNKFHSEEIVEGLVQAGLSVCWYGTSKKPRLIKQGARDYFSGGLLFPLSWFKHEVFRQWSMSAFDFFAGLHTLNSKLLWAFAPMNTRLIKQAIKKQIPVVLDVAIGHQREYQRIFLEEARVKPSGFHKRLIESWVKKYEWEYEHATWICAGSTYVRDTLVHHGVDAGKILVNHYGVDGTRWHASYQNRKPTGTMVFAYVAGITPRKGIHYLIDAWRRILPDNGELWIAGGSLEKVVEVCGELPPSVKVWGRLSHSQMQEFYSSVNVYVLPTLLEGLARSGIEAMSAGLPLVTTVESGLTDIMVDGETGWVVQVKDVDSLCKRISWCLNHPEEVSRAGERALAAARSMTFEVYGQRCAAIARKILADENPFDVPGVL